MPRKVVITVQCENEKDKVPMFDDDGDLSYEWLAQKASNKPCPSCGETGEHASDCDWIEE